MLDTSENTVIMYYYDYFYKLYLYYVCEWIYIDIHR